LPGSHAAARRVLAPASSLTVGGVPSIRWGASGWVASEPFLCTASLEPVTGPREPTARRVARGAGIRRRHGYSVRSVARRPWVQALGCARLWASARPNLQGKTPRLDGRLPKVPDAAHDATSKADASGISTARSWPRRAGVRPAWTHANNHERKKNTARRPELQNTGLGASPPRGTAARRGVFPRFGEQGCGKTPTPRAPDFAAWGSHRAGSPQNNTAQRRDLTRSSHGDGGAQEHERPRSSIRRGTTVLRLEGQHPGKI
jgi:hypothetical protein